MAMTIELVGGPRDGEEIRIEGDDMIDAFCQDPAIYIREDGDTWSYYDVCDGVMGYHGYVATGDVPRERRGTI